MCIILTCEPNTRPSESLVYDCFDANPDGAGLMWIEGGKVQTSKGYESPRELLNAISCVPKSSPLCIHMRIATSGGIDASVCHPFPICNSLETLHAWDTECDAAIMHNGVIASMPTDDAAGISDTVSFVRLVVAALYKRSHKVTKAMKRRITAAAPHNRFAILTSDGVITRIGDGWNTVTTGIQASNNSWRAPLYGYEWDGGDYDGDGEYGDVLEPYCAGCYYYATCASFGPMCDDVMDEIEQLWDADTATE